MGQSRDSSSSNLPNNNCSPHPRILQNSTVAFNNNNNMMTNNIVLISSPGIRSDSHLESAENNNIGSNNIHRYSSSNLPKSSSKFPSVSSLESNTSSFSQPPNQILRPSASMSNITGLPTLTMTQPNTHQINIKAEKGHLSPEIQQIPQNQIEYPGPDDQPPFTCKICKKIYKTRQRFIEHQNFIVENHGSCLQSFHCNICQNYTTTRGAYLQQHKQFKHPEQYEIQKKQWEEIQKDKKEKPEKYKGVNLVNPVTQVVYKSFKASIMTRPSLAKFKEENKIYWQDFMSLDAIYNTVDKVVRDSHSKPLEALRAQNMETKFQLLKGAQIQSQSQTQKHRNPSAESDGFKLPSEYPRSIDRPSKRSLPHSDNQARKYIPMDDNMGVPSQESQKSKSRKSKGSKQSKNSLSSRDDSSHKVHSLISSKSRSERLKGILDQLNGSNRSSKQRKKQKQQNSTIKSKQTANSSTKTKKSYIHVDPRKQKESSDYILSRELEFKSKLYQRIKTPNQNFDAEQSSSELPHQNQKLDENIIDFDGLETTKSKVSLPLSKKSRTSGKSKMYTDNPLVAPFLSNREILNRNIPNFSVNDLNPSNNLHLQARELNENNKKETQQQVAENTCYSERSTQSKSASDRSSRRMLLLSKDGGLSGAEKSKEEEEGQQGEKSVANKSSNIADLTPVDNIESLMPVINNISSEFSPWPKSMEISDIVGRSEGLDSILEEESDHPEDSDEEVNFARFI